MRKLKYTKFFLQIEDEELENECFKVLWKHSVMQLSEGQFDII